MSINFFKDSCQEANLTYAVFGLCDDQDGNKAYTDVNNPKKWIATVKNKSGKALTFTAIDYCIIKDNEQIERERCDGMLTSPNHIFFVELKDSRKDWKSDAIKQLESTIQFFVDNHDINIFKHKKAFACNRHHSHFQEIDNELSLRFFRKYGVRIDIQGEIVVE